jgi:sensor domain CHASE-containing protein
MDLVLGLRWMNFLPFAVVGLLQINFVLLISRQGKVRLTKWYSPYTQKERTKVSILY